MASGVVTVGRTRYAVGLYWENSPGSGRVAQTAKEAASQPGQQADFYAVRPGNKNGRIPQFGLVSSEAGQKSGMPVLAGCLALQIPGSWAGAFRLNEGIALIIVRDDLIVPDGDLFFIDESEARDRLIQEVGFGGLQATYAPEAWSIPGADTIPLTLLLNNRNDIKLQPVHISKALKIVGGISLVAFLALVGGIWYWQTKADEEAARLAQQQEAIRHAREAAQKALPAVLQPAAPPPVPQYERKWENAAPALQILEACHQGLSRVPWTFSGWRLTQLKCNGSTLNLDWAREKGMTTFPPGATVNDNGTAGTQTIILPTLQPRGPETLNDPEVVTKRYLMEMWPGTINRMANDPPPPPPPGYTGAWNPPPPPWVKRSFTFSVPELPGTIPDVLANLPGVVIENVSSSMAGTKSTWTVEGVIYENRK